VHCSDSLLPASESAGPPVAAPPVVAIVAGAAGWSSEAAGAAAGASGEVDVAGAARGLVATLFAGCDRCAVDWDEVNREKSSRMFRAASHPDKSNKPTPTVCLTRLLIVIPVYLNP
jgi:hypothetical protein